MKTEKEIRELLRYVEKATILIGSNEKADGFIQALKWVLKKVEK